MRDHPRQYDRQEADRAHPSPAEHEAPWARMSGRERIHYLLDLQNPPKHEGRADNQSPSDTQRVPSNIQQLLDLRGPRSADKPVPTGWEAPGVKDHPKRPDPEKISLPDDRRAHILGGDATGGGHRHGTGHAGKTEFPERWDDNAVIEHVLRTAREPERAIMQRNGSWRTRRVTDNVTVETIVKPDGRVWTSYPLAGGDGVASNPRKAESWAK